MKNFFVLSVILVATLVFGETMAASAQGYLGLPPIARDEFNRITRYYYYDAVCWMKDERHAQVIDSDEVATCDGAIDHLDRFVAKKKFTALFDARYRRIIELRRQELLQAELGKLGIQTIRTQLSDSKLHLSAPEQKMLMHLVRAGNLIEQAHHLQLNTWELNASAINRGTPTDAAFVRHFQTPWCEGIEDPLCNAMSTFPSERRFYPQSFFDDKGNARCDLLTKGGRELLNPFYAIVKGDKGFVAQPFTVAYRGALEPAAAELRQAAELAKALPNEKPLATYLDKAAEALLRDGLNPFHESDQAWLDAAHESKFYVRIGADEQYWEDCHVKAGYHAQIGIVDPVASQTLEAYRPHIKAMEGLFEKRIGTATYKARDVQVKMPEVVDVILFSGDARSANQTTIGQTLPNQCGPDGTEQCTSNRTIVYRNHIEASYTGKSAPRIYLMFAEEVRKNFNAQGSVDLTALHEFAHNLGPQREFKIASKEGKSAGEIFGEAAGFLEEFKAQTSAMSLQEYLLQKGVYTKDRVKANYTAGVMWMLGHLKKHLYAKDDFTKARSSYAKLAGIQFGWLVKQGAVSFNDADKVWQINYAKLPAAIESLMTTVGSIYASGNRDALEALTKQYLTGPMLAKYHLDVLEERVGSDPNVALHYEVLP